MGSWWRSEEMVYISLIVTEEAAISCIRELGTLGCIHADSTSGSGAYILENLENKLDTFEQQLRGLVDYNSQLSEQYTRKVEYHHLLVQAHRIIRASVVNPLLTLEHGDGATSGYQDSVLGSATDSSDLVMSFSNVSGVIKTQDRSRFERMLFRSTRGNCYVRFAPLSAQSVANDADGNVIEKLCFVVFYKSATIETKIIRICDAFEALHRAHLILNLPQNALIERVNGKWPTPPTHFVVNKYTYAYQEFVNTFGVPRYREANPALFTAATFPFLFGIMYGDIGHGVILTVAALYLVLTESKVKNNRSMDEMVKAVYSARFMLLGMGCCAVYAGLIYNDYFSLGLNLFGTRYTFKKSEDELYGNPDTVYPVGLDPVWHVSDNSLQFFNGMKMKMSVILGIAQMTIGIMLRGINSFYLTGYGLDFLAEFLPMIIFDVGFFGYMVLLIFIKWGNFGACNLSTANFCYTPLGDKCDADTPLPPDLITTLINIVLKPGQVDDPMYPGQEGVQTFLLLVSFITVPWLLCVKPYVLYKQHKAEKLEGSAHGAGMTTHCTGLVILSSAPAVGHHGDGEEFQLGEIIVHQGIETIEFVLGMVSNTASYLRLWALSLAHTELAEVFWEKVMVGAIEGGNPVGIFFQNKFYKGDGIRFVPFDFMEILSRSNID
eukprot:GSChrysophyteH1.ASY1.ANO1.167.1 assembled CDS